MLFQAAIDAASTVVKPTDWGVLAGATVTVITAIAGAVVLVVQAITRARKDILEAGHEAARQATIKANEIHALVNGKSDEAARKLADVEAKVAMLHSEIDRLQEQRIAEVKTAATAAAIAAVAAVEASRKKASS